MKNIFTLTRFKQFIAASLLAMSYMMSTVCLAETEYSLGLGYYNINAETSNGATSISNLGHIKLVYALDITERIVFWPGYSLYFLGGENADMGFGVDIEVAYYPFTQSGRFKAESNFGKWVSYETLRPFVSLSFNQRNYQSIQSSYAGIGLAIGADYQSSASIFYFGKLSYLSLEGPLEATIGEFQVAAGVGGFIGN